VSVDDRAFCRRLESNKQWLVKTDIMTTYISQAKACKCGRNNKTPTHNLSDEIVV